LEYKLKNSLRCIWKCQQNNLNKKKKMKMKRIKPKINGVFSNCQEKKRCQNVWNLWKVHVP
jgi:hypothetical protein